MRPEVQITCLCASLHLSDLRIHMGQNEVVYLDTQVATRSEDYQEALESGLIRVKHIPPRQHTTNQPVLDLKPPLEGNENGNL